MSDKLVKCEVCKKDVDKNKCWAIHSKGKKTYECLVKCNIPLVIKPLEIDIPDSYIVQEPIEEWGVQSNPTGILNSIVGFFSSSTQYTRVKQD